MVEMVVIGVAGRYVAREGGRLVGLWQQKVGGGVRGVGGVGELAAAMADSRSSIRHCSSSNKSSRSSRPAALPYGVLAAASPPLRRWGRRRMKCRQEF